MVRASLYWRRCGPMLSVSGCGRRLTRRRRSTTGCDPTIPRRYSMTWPSWPGWRQVTGC